MTAESSGENKLKFELQSLIDAQDHAFVVINENYTIVAANKVYAGAYGIKQSEIVGKKCHDVSHRSDRPCWQNGEDCPHKHVFDTGEDHNVLHIHIDQHDDEEHVRIKGSPIRGADGKLYLGEAIFPIANTDELQCNDQKLIGKSPAFLECVEGLTTSAKSEASVLMYGESGVGKDLAARYLHQQSSRKSMPFVHLDCTAVNEVMFESELFGHERGAFTGCVGRRNGLLEAADGGILFLDEVSDIPLQLQGRLLRALESGEFRRVGGRDLLKVDIRVISSTHKDLQLMIDEGLFRADLYYRMAGIYHELPSLRERREDIPSLIQSMLSKLADKNKQVCRMSGKAMDAMMKYDYPGNVRELNNILQQAVSLATDGFITLELLHFGNRPGKNSGVVTSLLSRAGNRSIDDVEKEHIEGLLERFDGHRSKVADVLHISERTLYRKIKTYELQEVGK